MSRLEIAYFRKFFNRYPRKEDAFVFPFLRKVYELEFSLWAKGKTTYNANSKKYRPKTLAWLTKQIMNHFKNEL